MGLILLLLSIIPHDQVVRDSYDSVELNHYFDEEGRAIFDQIIFYKWRDIYAGDDIVDWRLVKQWGHIPQRDRQQGGYIMIFDEDPTRVVRAKSFEETWTQHDPELTGRDTLPKEFRENLTRPRVPARKKAK